MNWFNIIAGLAGVVGVLLDMPTTVGGWLIGLGFLVLGIGGFMKMK